MLLYGDLQHQRKWLEILRLNSCHLEIALMVNSVVYDN